MNIPFVKQASELFLRLMNKLNNNFPLKTFEQSSQNPEESENIKYLEEVILTKKDIKFKEIQNILSSGEENKGSAPQISLFPKDLTVKCSSSYRQCFIATEHNE